MSMSALKGSLSLTAHARKETRTRLYQSRFLRRGGSSNPLYVPPPRHRYSAVVTTELASTTYRVSFAIFLKTKGARKHRVNIDATVVFRRPASAASSDGDDTEPNDASTNPNSNDDTSLIAAGSVAGDDLLYGNGDAIDPPTSSTLSDRDRDEEEKKNWVPAAFLLAAVVVLALL